LGQDDRCGICGKGSCSHLSYKEHIETKEGKALCGEKRDPILNSPDCAVDPDVICLKCQAKFEKIQGITIDEYQCQDDLTGELVTLLV